jgi:hypothetical protein
VSVLDATPTQLEFVDREPTSFLQAGAWEPSTCSDYVARLFLVLKPGSNQWRPICDLRPLNKQCIRKLLKMEMLMEVKHLTRKGDYMFSFDLQDGFYTMGVNQADRDYVTVNVRGHLFILAGLPMGRFLCPFYFCKMTLTFVNSFAHWTLNSLSPRMATTRRPTSKERACAAPRFSPTSMTLYYSHPEEHALTLRQRLAKLLDRVGLLRHPTTGVWTPAQVGHHLGIDINTSTC